MGLLKVDALAPDFKLDDGRMASDIWCENHLVIYFFPKAFTPG